MKYHDIIIETIKNLELNIERAKMLQPHIEVAEQCIPLLHKAGIPEEFNMFKWSDLTRKGVEICLNMSLFYVYGVNIIVRQVKSLNQLIETREFLMKNDYYLDSKSDNGDMKARTYFYADKKNRTPELQLKIPICLVAVFDTEIPNACRFIETGKKLVPVYKLECNEPIA